MSHRPKVNNPRWPDKDDPVWSCPVVPIGSPTGPGGWFSNPVPVNDDDLEIEPHPLPPVDFDNLPPLVEKKK
tara:strand:- start:240 stop:455 length:216 start_codon:yes stop_codon:yes gene_type:complete